MAWLDSNPPRRSQFRRGRRQRLRPVIVGHTAENPWPTSNAAGVANFIRSRTDPGSYHKLTDDQRVIDLVDLNNEAYHDGTGSNPWSMGISAACRTIDWARMPAATRARFMANLAVAAARCNHHSVRSGAGRVEPRQITRAQSNAGVSGFIPHGARDPGRRTDWGTTSRAPFPWAEFFSHYRRAIGTVPPSPSPPTGGFLMSLTAAEQREIRDRLRAIDLRMVQQQERTATLLARTASIWAWTRVLVEIINGGRLGALRADLHARAKALIGSAPDRN